MIILFLGELVSQGALSSMASNLLVLSYTQNLSSKTQVFTLCKSMTTSCIWHLNHWFPQTISAPRNFHFKLFQSRHGIVWLKKSISTLEKQLLIRTKFSLVTFPMSHAWQIGHASADIGEAEHISVNIRDLVWIQLNTLTYTSAHD